MRRLVTCSAVLISVALAVPAARSRPGPTAPPDVATLLDSYHRGAHDETRRALARLTREELPAFRGALTKDAGPAWLTGGEDPARRVATAAAVAVELEAIAVERGQWSTIPTNAAVCAGRCVIRWAGTRLAERPTPDAFEREWLLAALAVAGAARDWAIVYSPLSPVRATRRPPAGGPAGSPAPVDGLAAYAAMRFPDDARFRLARAIAIAARYGVMTEMEAPRPGQRSGATPAFVPDVPGLAFLPGRATANIEFAIQQFADLVGDPDVGAEAQARRAYLYLRLGKYEVTLVDARAAATAAQDADIRYLAWFLAGMAAQTLGDFDAADAHYAAALEARPHSQSAVVARAALRFQQGDADTAAGLVSSAFATRPGDNDPWRLFLYGDYRLLEQRLQAMRARLSQ